MPLSSGSAGTDLFQGRGFLANEPNREGRLAVKSRYEFQAPSHRVAIVTSLLLCCSPAFGDCDSRAFSAAEQEIQPAYFGYYGRVADTGGLDFWSGQLEAAGGDLSAVIDAFGNSQEFDDVFGGLTNEELVTNLYQQIFGRDPDPEGFDFYVSSLYAGTRTLQSIALDILYGARNDDAVIIANKLSVSNHFVTELERLGLGYLEGSRAILAAVTADPSSAVAACDQVDNLFATAAFSVTGQSFAAQLNLSDGDVNDVNAPYSSNDWFDSAQEVPNIAVVGGYVNLPYAGDAGRSSFLGDIDDYYRVQLEAGDGIRLRFEDPLADDVDLYLFRSDKSLADASVGTGSEEFLTAPETGTYYVLVAAYDGASTYNLTIGAAESGSAATEILRLSDPFVPGEAVVRLVPDADDAPRASEVARAIGLKVRAGAPGRARLMGRDDTAGRRGPAERRPFEGYLTDAQAAALDTVRVIKALRRRGEVRFADPNYLQQPLRRPNDTEYGRQWHYPAINLEAAWDRETGASDVVVAVVDTGVLLDHPDLQGQLTAGYDFVRSTSRSGDGDGIDPNPDDPGDESGIDGSSSFHGTHVAGTVAAASDNGMGVAGVAWNSRVMPVRVLGAGGLGDSYDVLQGVRFAAGLANDSGTVPAEPAAIVNLSLGGGGYSSSAQDVFRQVRDAGVLVVAAAGNESSSSPSYPAGYEGVVAVSAVGPTKALAPYSNFGAVIDISAPGGDLSIDVNGDGDGDGVLSTLASDGTGTIRFAYDFYHGTSMAAPHVAGVAALMKSAYPPLTPDDFDGLLVSQAIVDDLGAPGRDDSFGYGLVNAGKAVSAAEELGGQPPLPAMLSAAPASLTFGLLESSLEVVLSSTGEGDLGVDPVPAISAPWLRAAPIDVDADNLGRYLVALDRSGLAAGVYSGSVTFVSSVNAVTVPVSMEVTDLDYEPDVGYLYVLLYDPETDATLDQKEGSADAGVYTFSFAGVAPGAYWIIAGSDFDNDGYICDAGESCGAYPTGSSLPESLVVDRDLSGLDFVSAFESSVSSLGAKALPGGDGRGFRRLSAP